MKTTKLNEKEIKEFDAVKAAISKTFTRDNFGNHLNLVYNEKSKQGIALNSNAVLGITYKSELGFLLLQEFLPKESTSPNLKYDVVTGVCNYSCTYMKFVFDVFSKFKSLSKGAVKISVKEDYPATIENEHIKFVMAPRTED